MYYLLFLKSSFICIMLRLLIITNSNCVSFIRNIYHKICFLYELWIYKKNMVFFCFIIFLMATNISMNVHKSFVFSIIRIPFVACDIKPPIYIWKACAAAYNCGGMEWFMAQVVCLRIQYLKHFFEDLAWMAGMFK